MGAIAKVDTNSSAIQLIIIHISNRAKCRLWILKLNKGKPTRLSRFHVSDQSHFDDSANLGKCLMQLVLRGAECEISNEDVMFLLILLLT
jgi:hypothetical protein